MSRSLPPALRFVRRALQVLRALAFLHSLSLIHADLKPENILIKSYSRCEVKVGGQGGSSYVGTHAGPPGNTGSSAFTHHPVPCSPQLALLAVRRPRSPSLTDPEQGGKPEQGL